MIDVLAKCNTVQTTADKMWVAGWMLAKYEKMQLLPETDSEIAEWFHGFTMGTVEAVLYDHLNERLEYLLQGYDEIFGSIQRWRQQDSQIDGSRLPH